LVRSDSGKDEATRGTERGVKLNSREWGETVQKLAAMALREPPLWECGDMSPLLKALTYQRAPKTLLLKTTKPCL